MELERALQVHDDAELLFAEEAVEQGIEQLAAKVAEEYQDRNPLVLCVMNGGLYLTGQLLRHWNFPMTLDYVHATRYRLKTLGRDVLWKAYPQNSLRNRSVLIIDDIYDQGYTLEEVKSYCMNQGAASCQSVFLIRKNRECKRADVDPDFVGLECGDCYVYGAGMDLNSHFRYLSSIYSLPAKVD